MLLLGSFSLPSGTVGSKRQVVLPGPLMKLSTVLYLLIYRSYEASHHSCNFGRRRGWHLTKDQ